MALFVAVAHSGKMLQLGVQSSQRVEAVQQALFAFTGVPVADQILMLAGAKLDPSRHLAAYKLPIEDVSAAAEEPVMLYCKSHLRPGLPIPVQESLPPIIPQVPPALSSTNLAAAVAAHPLSNSTHAAVRSLPSHEVAMSQHVATAAAYCAASAARFHRCRQLVSEQEVQSRAADAATVNVEVHYSWITTSMAAFMSKYNQQCSQNAQLLGSFSEDQALLTSITIHPSLQVGSVRCLSDLPLAVRSREVAASCRKYHGQFSEKVAQLESVYNSMKLDMESLMMQAPTVDLDILGVQLVEAEGWLEEQDATLQVLNKDLSTVKQLVEQVVRRSAGPGGLNLPVAATGSATSKPQGDVRDGSTSSAAGGGQGMVQLLDACQAVPAMVASHGTQLLPRLAALDACMAVLEEKCIAAKQQMTRDVLSMLQRIAMQQSKIRDMRARLVGFDALLQRQTGLFAELRPLGRLTAAYRALLAECERRHAWHQLKTAQAAEFVEQLVAQYTKEGNKRESFVRQVERYLPHDMLSAAGLLEGGSLPLPTVSVPPPPAHLLSVSLKEVQQLPVTSPAVSTATAALSLLLNPGSSGSGGPGDAPGQQHRPSRVDSQDVDEGVIDKEEAAGAEEAGEAAAAAYAPVFADPISMHKLEMDNARLRAELADLLAETSLARLQGVGPAAGPGFTTPPQTFSSAGLGMSIMQQASARGVSGLGESTILSAPSSHPDTSASARALRRDTSTGHEPGSTSGGQYVGSLPGTSPLLGHSSSWRRQGSALPGSAGVSGALPVVDVNSSPSHRAAAGLLAGQVHVSSGSSPGVSRASPSPSTTGPLAAPMLGTSPHGAGMRAGGPSGSGVGATAGQQRRESHSSAKHTPSSSSIPLHPTSSNASESVAASLAMAGSALVQSQAGLPHAHSLPAGSVLEPGGAAGAGAAGVAPAERMAVSALQQAVSMKQKYCDTLMHELTALNSRVTAYEQRIRELEERIANQQQQQVRAADQMCGSGTAGVSELLGDAWHTRTAPGTQQHEQPEHQPGGGGGGGGEAEAWPGQTGQPGGDGSSGMGGGQHVHHQFQPQDSETFDPLMSSSYLGTGASAASQPAPGPAAAPPGAASSTQREGLPPPGPTAGSAARPRPNSSSPFAPVTDGGVGRTSSAGSGGAAHGPEPLHQAQPFLSLPANAVPVLGPIALAAMAGSRGHTPEPPKALAGSVASLHNLDLNAGLGLLLAGRTGTNNGVMPASNWHEADAHGLGLMVEAPADAWRPTPLFPSKWGSTGTTGNPATSGLMTSSIQLPRADVDAGQQRPLVLAGSSVLAPPLDGSMAAAVMQELRAAPASPGQHMQQPEAVAAAVEDPLVAAAVEDPVGAPAAVTDTATSTPAPSPAPEPSASAASAASVCEESGAAVAEVASPDPGAVQHPGGQVHPTAGAGSSAVDQQASVHLAAAADHEPHTGVAGSQHVMPVQDGVGTGSEDAAVPAVVGVAPASDTCAVGVDKDIVGRDSDEVPDLDEMLSGPLAGDAEVSAGQQAGQQGAGQRQEVRAWPAAGSALGCSAFGMTPPSQSQGTSSLHSSMTDLGAAAGLPAGAVSSADTASNAASGVGGAVGSGAAVTGSLAGTSSAVADSEEGSAVQASMYASAMGGMDLSSMSQRP